MKADSPESRVEGKKEDFAWIESYRLSFFYGGLARELFYEDVWLRFVQEFLNIKVIIIYESFFLLLAL